MRALRRGTKQSEKTMEEGCREGEGERVEEHSREFVCQGLLALESFLFRFIVTLRENFCYFSRPAFTRVTPDDYTVRRGVNAPLKPKSHDKSFPVLPRPGNV